MPEPKFDPWIVDRELIEYETSDCIFTPSEAARASYARAGVPLTKVRKIPYGIDVARFAADQSLQRVPGRVLSVGRVGIQKGHHYLLHALSSLANQVEVHGRFVGPIDQAFKRRFVRELESVTCVGAVSRDRVVREMQKAQVFVLASVHEGLALVVLEAMAAGLPVVATTATGCEDLIDNGETGIVVEPGDSEAIAQAIHALLEDDQLRNALGAKARERALEYAASSSYGGRVSDALSELARENR